MTDNTVHVAGVDFTVSAPADVEAVGGFSDTYLIRFAAAAELPVEWTVPAVDMDGLCAGPPSPEELARMHFWFTKQPDLTWKSAAASSSTPPQVARRPAVLVVHPDVPSLGPRERLGGVMDVQLVNVETADGVRLDGYLRTAAATASAPLGVDVVICHHGVGGNFYAPSFFDTVGDALVANGTAILRVNNRGHDQAFHLQQRRLGAAYEVVDDCRLDFRAWLDFAVARGFRRVAVWGHSLGAVKTIYFLSTASDPQVVCAVASSPPRFVHQAYLALANGARFKADIDHAQRLVDAGQPEALVEAQIPQARAFSARTCLDKYGPADRYDYFQHLPRTGVPLLLTLGSLERQEVSFAPLAERGPSMTSEWPNVSYALIDGADHSYTGRTDALWQTASTWLKPVAAPTSVS